MVQKGDLPSGGKPLEKPAAGEVASELTQLLKSKMLMKELGGLKPFIDRVAGDEAAKRDMMSNALNSIYTQTTVKSRPAILAYISAPKFQDAVANANEGAESLQL